MEKQQTLVDRFGSILFWLFRGIIIDVLTTGIRYGRLRIQLADGQVIESSTVQSKADKVG
jgi:hypothetical protein